MGGDYFSLAVPVIVFTILLLDIRRQIEDLREDSSINRFKIARFIIILALVLSLVLGVMEILNINIRYSLVNYSKTFNLLILIGYLILTRFRKK